ncbi:Integral membrane protein OS=Streptomyces glaucescens OX=1907 GN=SGLAU_04405 PE=4 SV=1 [Streptomyces glaucescens]
MSCQPADAWATAGLLVVAVGPWVPGGASTLGTAQPALRWGMEGAAAFIPLTVCTATALGYVLAPLARDPVPLLVGGTALLSLWARQRFLPSEDSRSDD